MVALSEYVIKNCLKRPVVEKSWWRHIRLAMKPRYLGNHASQIKSYYVTLSGSHGRTFRIRHEKSRKAPPGGEIMMLSYSAGNKTSLYRKPCIPDKKLLWNTVGKSWSLFQNPSWKIAWSAPKTVKSRWRDILFVIKARLFVCLLLNGTSALFRPLVPRIV